MQGWGANSEAKRLGGEEVWGYILGVAASSKLICLAAGVSISSGRDTSLCSITRPAQAMASCMMSVRSRRSSSSSFMAWMPATTHTYSWLHRGLGVGGSRAWNTIGGGRKGGVSWLLLLLLPTCTKGGNNKGSEGREGRGEPQAATSMVQSCSGQLHSFILHSKRTISKADRVQGGVAKRRGWNLHGAGQQRASPARAAGRGCHSHRPPALPSGLSLPHAPAPPDGLPAHSTACTQQTTLSKPHSATRTQQPALSNMRLATCLQQLMLSKFALLSSHSLVYT